MNIGHVQRTFTAEPVLDPVPGSDPAHPLETVPASGPRVPGLVVVDDHGERHAETLHGAAGATAG